MPGFENSVVTGGEWEGVGKGEALAHTRRLCAN